MLIIWGGSLAVLLNKLWRSMCRIEKVKDDYIDTTKLCCKIGRRVMRAILHKERPSMIVVVYYPECSCKMLLPDTL